MIFFQRHRDQPAQATEETPALEPPALPKEEKPEPADTVIHIDDAHYCELTRALRPEVAPAPQDLPDDAPGSDVSSVAGGASQPTPVSPTAVAPEQIPGTPIV